MKEKLLKSLLFSLGIFAVLFWWYFLVKAVWDTPQKKTGDIWSVSEYNNMVTEIKDLKRRVDVLKSRYSKE